MYTDPSSSSSSMISTTAETIQYPAQPLFVECSGPPLLDQDHVSIKMNTSPITDFKEEQCMLSDTECDPSMTDDGLYLGDSSYLSFPSDVTQTEVSNDSVKYDASSKPISSLLVPVRDPETKIIKNVLVPPEMQDESGMNIIKSILIPVQEPDGLVTYVIKSVMVPIKLEKQVRQPIPVPVPIPTPVKETPPKPDKIGKKEKKKKKLSKKVENAGKKKKGMKPEELEQAESVEPNEEVDSILANLRTTCPFCQKSFKSEQQVNKHVRREHQQPFRCKKCHYSYTKEEELEKHMEVHEKDTYHKCPFCHLKYKRMSGLRAHQIREHSNVDPVCLRDRVKEGSAEDSPTGSAGTRIYVCQVCGNDYAQKSYLIAHNRIAHGYQRNEVRRFKCRVCKKKFTFQHSLESHLCNEPSFLCSHCGKKFSTNYTMLLHMRNHTGERPHQCTVCQKSFSRAVSLRIHKLTHTGERPYICDLCGQSFTQRTTMMIHRRKHPGNHPPPPPLFLSRRMSNMNEEKE